MEESLVGTKVKIKKEFWTLYNKSELNPMVIVEDKKSDLGDMQAQIFYFAEFPETPFLAHHFEPGD
jgi:hypothetical protein